MEQNVSALTESVSSLTARILKIEANATSVTPQFWLYGVFIPNNLNAGGSVVCIHTNLLLEGAIVTHVVTLRAMITLNFQSGRARPDPEEPTHTGHAVLKPLGGSQGTSKCAILKREDSTLGIRFSLTVMLERPSSSIFHFFRRAVGCVNVGVQFSGRAMKPSGAIAMILFCVVAQKALDDIRWEIDRDEFDELMASKKGIRSRSRWDSMQSLQVCWRVGFSFFYNAYKYRVEGGPVPTQFAASRTVFIPKTSDIDNNGFVVR